VVPTLGHAVRALAQAVRRLPVNMEARFRFQVSPSERFLVDEVVLGQVSANVIPPLLDTHSSIQSFIYHRSHIILASVSVVKEHTQLAMLRLELFLAAVVSVLAFLETQKQNCEGQHWVDREGRCAAVWRWQAAGSVILEAVLRKSS